MATLGNRLAKLERRHAPPVRVVLFRNDDDLRDKLAALERAGRLDPHRRVLCLPLPMSPAEWEREAIAIGEQLAHEAAERRAAARAAPQPTPDVAAPEHPAMMTPTTPTTDTTTDRRAYTQNVRALHGHLRRR